MVAARQPGQAGDLLLVADEAARAARQLAVEHLIAEVARPVAVEQDPPRLHRRRGEAQRREGNADLERPAGGGDPRRRVPVEVRRGVLAAGVVGDRVVLDAARIGEELERRLAVVAGVEGHPAVVGGARQVVVVAERRADALRIGVREVERDIEEVVVVGQPGDRLHLRLDAVAGVRLVEGLDPRRPLPPRIAQPAVDLDRPLGARNSQRGGILRASGARTPRACRGSLREQGGRSGEREEQGGGAETGSKGAEHRPSTAIGGQSFLRSGSRLAH